MDSVNMDDLVGNDHRRAVNRKDIRDLSPVSDNSGSSSAASINPYPETRSGGLKLKHPLASSYKEWIRNWFRISIPAIGFLGCQLSLALQNGFVTPELEELGIPEKVVNYCWLAPPITGCFIQPLIGITSDMMDVNTEGSFANKYGRRRPFVAIGCVLVVTFLLLFSNARYIGVLFGDDEDNTNNAAMIGVLSFWFLDIAINIVQAPLRALVSDIIPPQHHTTANGVFGFANGLGAIIGYALGYGLAYNPKLGGNLTALFAIASCTVICTSVIMLYLTKGERLMYISSTSLSDVIAKNYASDGTDVEHLEERALLQDGGGGVLPSRHQSIGGLSHLSAISVDDLNANELNPLNQSDHGNDADHNNNNGINPNESNAESEVEIVLQLQRSKYQRIKDAVGSMPRPISRAYLVQFWLYFGLFASYIYLTDWFGKKVTGGDPHSNDDDVVERYRYGVRMASIGLSFGAIFAVVGSMVLPFIIKRFGYRWTWFFCMLLYASFLLATPFCSSIAMGLVIVTCLGIGQATAMVIGWSIVTETVAKSDQKGIYTTLFSTSHTVPELVTALSAGEIIHLFGSQVSAVLAVGGIFALFGANAALYIVEPKKWLAKQAWLERHSRARQIRDRQSG